MSNDSTITFEDIVRKIARKPEDSSYTVVFRRHAAFYVIDGNNREAVEALSASARERTPVTVEVNPGKSEILRANR